MLHHLIAIIIVSFGFFVHFIYNKVKPKPKSIKGMCATCQHEKMAHFHPEYPDLINQCAGKDEFSFESPACLCKRWVDTE
jgi:hypothetical protein